MMGNGQGLPGAVLLGGREYRVTISRVADENLKVLAKMQGKRTQAYAEELFDWAITFTSRRVQTAIVATNILLSGFVTY